MPIPYLTGWIARTHQAIPFDLENTPLEIKTGVSETAAKISMKFENSDGHEAAGFAIVFSTSPAKYRLYDCSMSGGIGYWHSFNKEVTSKVKIWRFTKTRTSEIRVRIHCNDVELANVVLSDSFCGDNNWKTRWTRYVSQIFISKYDYASDFYRPYQLRPGKLFMTDQCSFDKNQIASASYVFLILLHE